MVNFRVDNLWPWFRFEPSDEVPGFRMTADAERGGLGLSPFGYGASGQATGPTDVDHELGLFQLATAEYRSFLAVRRVTVRCGLGAAVSVA